MAYDEFTAKLVADNERLLAEIERLRKDLSLAVFADNEYWQVLEKENERLRSALERIAFGKYHWEADAQEEARAALETREAGVSSEVKND